VNATVSSRPRDRILDVFGLFARSHGGWVAVRDLITLMAEFDIDAQAVRSAASRMKRSGLLLGERLDGTAGYALSPRGNEILDDGDRRIFPGSPSRAEDGSWVLVLFSVPEAERKKRYLIRSQLARLGFAQGPAASWIAPVSLLDEALRMLERGGLDSYVSFFEAEFRAPTSEADVVAAAWDFDGIRKRYEEYLSVYAAIAESWLDSPGTDREAFAHLMNNVNSWRPLPYADPGFPPSVVPREWPAEAARGVFARLDRQVRPGADRFFRAAVSTTPR